MSYYIPHKSLVARQEPVNEASPALSTPAIVGIAVGSFFALALILFVIFFVIQHRKVMAKKSKIANEMNPITVIEEDEEARLQWDNSALNEKYEDIILPPSEWHSKSGRRFR